MARLNFYGLVGVILLLSLITIAACAPGTSNIEIPPSPTKTLVPTAPQAPTPTRTAIPDTPLPPTPTSTTNPTPTSTTNPTPTSTPEPSPTPLLVTEASEILGLWHGEGRDGMYFKFDQDGSCQQTLTRDSVDTNPNVTCQYRFEGDRFVMTTLEVRGLPPCQQTEVVYEVHRLDNGNIKFVNIDDKCAPRIRSTAVEHVPTQ